MTITIGDFSTRIHSENCQGTETQREKPKERDRAEGPARK
jgi:hypothetical protein